MIKPIVMPPLALLLSACMALPGSDAEPALRFDLPEPGGACAADTVAPVAVTVAEVSPALDTDRVARRNAGTGEITYLKDVRWVGRSSVVVEKALARDLECRGFAALSGPHRRGEHDQLVCELRALNLVDAAEGDSAEAGLSCMLFREGAADIAVVARGRSGLNRWSASAAITALGAAYSDAARELIEQLPSPAAARY